MTFKIKKKNVSDNPIYWFNETLAKKECRIKSKTLFAIQEIMQI